MIEGNRIFLELLCADTIDELYVDWINDPVVNKFLSSEDKVYTKQDLVDYLKDITRSGSAFMFGIYILSNKKYIGNIKLSNTDDSLGSEIGLMIGDKEEWGKGYSTEAICCIEKFAYSIDSITTLRAGVHKANPASLKAFLKNGFTIAEEVFREFKSETLGGYILEKKLKRNS